MEWGAVATIIVAVLAAAFAGIGYLIRINRERRRILCRNLFNLLEIWHQLRVHAQIEPKRVIEQYLTKFKLVFPDVQISAAETDQTKRLLIPMWKTLLGNLFENDDKSMSESFKESIRSLAEIDPILAFRLSGNPAIKTLLTNIDGYMHQLESAFDIEASKRDETRSALSSMFSDTRNYVYRDAIKELENDLLRLAFQISPPMLMRTWFRILKRRRNEKERLSKSVDLIIEKIVVPNVIQNDNPLSCTLTDPTAHNRRADLRER